MNRKELKEMVREELLAESQRARIISTYKDLISMIYSSVEYGDLDKSTFKQIENRHKELVDAFKSLKHLAKMKSLKGGV